MNEREYHVATTLAKLRIAESVLRSAVMLETFDTPEMVELHKQAVAAVDRLTDLFHERLEQPE